MIFQTDLRLILAVYACLLFFGALYNLAVARAEGDGTLEGYTALAVALGVGVTLAGLALIDWQASLLLLGGFACSGAPMIAGSIGRHAAARRAEQRTLRHSDDGPTAPLA